MFVLPEIRDLIQSSYRGLDLDCLDANKLYSKQTKRTDFNPENHEVEHLLGIIITVQIDCMPSKKGCNKAFQEFSILYF